jgi:hypothetical protein
MLEIVQIGQWPFRLIPTDEADVSYDTSLKWRIGKDTLTHVPGIKTHSDYGRPLNDELKWKIKGSIVCGNGADSCDSIWAQFQQMASLAGGPFRIIAAYDQTGTTCDCDTTNNNGPLCINCGQRKYAQWMHTCVELVSLKRVFEWGNGESYPGDVLIIDMEVVPVKPYWEPIDDIRWRWWWNNKPSWSFIGGQDWENPVKYIQPDYIPRPWGNNAGFQFLDRPNPQVVGGEMMMMLRPENWETAYVRPDPYPLRAHFVGPNLPAPRPHTFYSYLESWSAPPKSLYHFGELNTTGQLFINVVGATPHQVYVSNTATLDLAALNANLNSAGFTGIQAGDYMIVGDTGFGGGLYIRNNQILNAYIPWQYDNLYPGYTYPGWNTVNVHGDCDEFTCLHIFRSH